MISPERRARRSSNGSDNSEPDSATGIVGTVDGTVSRAHVGIEEVIRCAANRAIQTVSNRLIAYAQLVGLQARHLLAPRGHVPVHIEQAKVVRLQQPHRQAPLNTVGESV